MVRCRRGVRYPASSKADAGPGLYAADRRERDAWFPKDATYEEQAEIGCWAGCTASFVESDIAENAVHILKEGGVKFAYLARDEACCGVPFFVAGKMDEFEKALRHNISQLQARGVKKLVISRPGCWVAFSHYYRQWAAKWGIEYDLTILHISEITADLIREGKLHFKKEIPQKLTWHDPCHIGRHGGIYDAPREVIKAIPGVAGVAAMPSVVQDPTLAAMERMMPAMMPSMLPSMMPKMMPRVLELMRELIPGMPPHMEEMLPDLLPKVMARIMPPMVPEAAPKIAPLMTDFLRRK